MAVAWHGRCRVVACSVLVLRAPIGFGDAAVFWSPAVFLERWCRIPFVVTRWRWLSKRGTRIWSWCYIVCAVDSLFLSSLVQAIAYPVLHQFGALGTLYSLLCWSFSSRCHPYFHGSLSHYDGRPRSVVCFWSLRYMVVFIPFWSCSVLCMPGILREDR